MEGLIPAYVSALCQELDLIAKSSPKKIPLHTIFFGGGTPSILPKLEVNRIITTIKRNFELLDNVEISLEANPGGLSLDYLKSLQEIGINRLMVEGGGTLNFELLRLGLVDEVTIYIAPLVFGGESAPTLAAGSGLVRSDAIRLELTEAETWEDGGVVLKYKITNRSERSGNSQVAR